MVRSFESLGRKGAAVAFSFGLAVATLSGCGEQDGYYNCYGVEVNALQGKSDDATTWIGKPGIFARSLAELGVKKEAYFREFDGDEKTREAIRKSLGHSSLQIGDIAMFCVSFDDGQDFNKGGTLTPYTTPTAGQLHTTPGGDNNYTRAAYEEARAKYPRIAIFEVNPAQTEFVVPRKNPAA